MTKSVAKQMGPMISPSTIAFHGARGTSLESCTVRAFAKWAGLADSPFRTANQASSA